MTCVPLPDLVSVTKCRKTVQTSNIAPQAPPKVTPQAPPNVTPQASPKQYRSATSKQPQSSEQIYLAGTQTKNPTDAFNFFASAAKMGHSKAQYLTAMCYYNGEGVAKNIQNAIGMLQQLASMNADAQYFLGNLYIRGENMLRNEKIAYNMFYAAAAQNHCEACFDLAVCIERGYGCQPNLAVAEKWYQQALSLGCQRAKNRLQQLMPIEQDDVELLFPPYKHFDLQFKCQTKVVEHTLLDSMVNEELSSENGISSIMYSAAAKHHPAANVVVGIGHASNQEYRQAKACFLSAASQGNPFGKYNMGILCLREGIRIQIDSRFDFDEPDTDVVLGNSSVHYTKDIKMAKSWFAQVQSNPMALYNTGVCYLLKGKFHKAYENFKNSASMGFPSAAHNMNTMKQRMPGEGFN